MFHFVSVLIQNAARKTQPPHNIIERSNLGKLMFDDYLANIQAPFYNKMGLGLLRGWVNITSFFVGGGRY